MLLPLILPLCTSKKSPARSPRCPPSCSEMTSPQPSRLLLALPVLQPPARPVASTALTPARQRVLHWGAQNWTQHSRCALTSARERGRIAPLGLLPTLLLTQPSTWLPSLHQGLTADSHSTCPPAPRSLAAELLPSQSAPAWPVAGVTPAWDRTWYLLWLNFGRFLTAHFPNLPKCL